MSKQFNSIIATQRVEFTGTTSVSIPTSLMPNFKAITGAVYALRITGGVSGTFGIAVYGHIGGATYAIAGLTALSGVGRLVLYRASYSFTGAINPLETIVGITATVPGLVIPPSMVEFSAVGAANAIGISATIEVGACIAAN
ncbi:hypothetical protein LCGC14_0866110 [marine sediment metagenome]|uniref:Uncharacterized protein n=1 Tax=marine sediment metagenome TaxID=412755 RepID=A0A0F9RQQ3_9ZZZZ